MLLFCINYSFIEQRVLTLFKSTMCYLKVLIMLEAVKQQDFSVLNTLLKELLQNKKKKQLIKSVAQVCCLLINFPLYKHNSFTKM